MTSHHGRLYALALTLVVFFLAWAVVAARPWAASTPDPRLRRLAVREARLRREAVLVRAVVAARWDAYRVRLKLRRAEIAQVKAKARAQAAAAAAAAHASALASIQASAAPSAPAVRVVTLPPLTVTRTS